MNIIENLESPNVWIITYSDNSKLHPAGKLVPSALGDAYICIVEYDDVPKAQAAGWPQCTPFPTHVLKQDIRMIIELKERNVPQSKVTN